MAHSRQHDISTAAEHSASGLTAGHVLRATAATTFAFAAIGASDLPTAIDAANIANGTISNAEFQYLNGVTGAIQGQIDAKMPLAGGTFTGDVLFQVAEQCRFRQATEYFASDNPGYLDAHAATAFRLTTTGRVSLTCPANGVLGVAGDVWVISDGGDPRIVLGDTWSAGDYGSIRWVSASDSIGIGTQAGGVDTLLISEAGNVLLAGTGQFQFGDSGTYLYQSANSILSYVADGRHEFGGGPVYVGSGSPGHTITGAGDLYVADRFEVDGAAYFDDQTYFYGLMDCRDQHVMSFFGSTFGGLYRVGGDGLHFYVYAGAGGAQNRNLIICDYAGRADDYDHSATSAHPTWMIHSVTRAASQTDEYLALSFPETHALLAVGSGWLEIAPDILSPSSAKHYFDAGASQGTEYITSGADTYLDLYHGGGGGLRVYDDANLLLTVQRYSAGLPTYTSLRVPGGMTLEMGAQIVLEASATYTYLQAGTAIALRNNTHVYADNRWIGFGAGGGLNNPDAKIYYDGVNLIIRPAAVGTGIVYIGASGENNIRAGGYHDVNNAQVVSTRVIDDRCDDALNTGDATSDGVIASLRSAMIAHGLIAAS